jgi:hypothetical protein
MAKSTMMSEHVLIDGKRKIVVHGKTIKAVIKAAQPIINKHPKTHYRYAKIVIDRTRPWFKKGE